MRAAGSKPRVVVAAAVIEQERGFLVTRRLKGVHLEGYWEFPGGKCEPAETLVDCLKREMEEELGSAVDVGAELLVTSHDYADREVELHFISCRLRDDPRPLLGQEMRWVSRDDLTDLAFPPADQALITLLQQTADR